MPRRQFEDGPVFGINNFAPPRPSHSPFRGDFVRPRSGENVSDSYATQGGDYIMARSPSSGAFRSPIRSTSSRHLDSPARQSPTAYMAAPHAPASANWGPRSPINIRSPNPPVHEAQRRPVIAHGIHSPPSSSNRRHPISTSPSRRQTDDHTQHNTKPPRATLMSEIKRAFRNFLFALIVCLLVALVIWLFSGDFWYRLVSADPNKRCAEQLKFILRDKAGEAECHHSTRSIPDAELKLAMTAICVKTDRPLEWSKVRGALLSDGDIHSELTQTGSESLYYSGPDPRLPWGCFIKGLLGRFLRAYGIYVAGILSILGFIQYVIYRFRRRRSDAALARANANHIIRLLQETYADPAVGTDGSLIKDHLESDFTNDAAGKRVWPQVVDLVERNTRVQVIPKDFKGAQVQAWAWSRS